jgi:hypothetical protein
MFFPSWDLIQFVEKIWESLQLYDSLLIFSSPHTNRSLLYILEFVFFSQTLYFINIFVNNRDQGFATFITLNTTCISSKKKFGRKYIIWENLNLNQRYRVYYRGGVRTIPTCNAVRRGFLHIIDFSFCAVIVRSAFAVFTPRGFKRFRIDL